MRYVRVDAREWETSRFHQFIEAAGLERAHAIGVLVVLTHYLRDRGATAITNHELGKLFFGPFDMRIRSALIGAGYLIEPRTEAGYRVAGAEAFQTARERRVAAAKAGVAGRAKKAAKPARAPRTPKKANIVQLATSQVWEAYKEAYVARWGTEPVRNMDANRHVKRLVEQVGAEAAYHLVRFYVGHNEPFYIKNTHALQYCVKDCSTLHTQMCRGEAITRRDVQQAEKQNSYVSQLQRVSNGEL